MKNEPMNFNVKVSVALNVVLKHQNKYRIYPFLTLHNTQVPSGCLRFQIWFLVNGWYWYLF
jgi:hypothetical protein